MPGEEDNDVVRYALERPQPDAVVLDRVAGAVEHGNEGIGEREHVAGDEDSAFFERQRRMAQGMRRNFDSSKANGRTEARSASRDR
ncbi:hypothetical protein [Streptomyces sp. NPDC045251]|uniref:hypothetical protein n=1 Tax=unclassified Streptomyces TaxID=2593676 RepID=UPI0034027951